MKKQLLIFLLLAVFAPWTVQAQTKTHIANISSSTQMTWAEFANSVNNGTTYEGMTLFLDSDVEATTMAGTSATNCFKGTFDGQGNALRINYIATEWYTAPFRYLNGATIQNLEVTGDIYANAARSGGLAGECYGNNTITNCRNTVIIRSSLSSDGTHGGFVSIVREGTTTFESCAFNGRLFGTNTYKCGGFVGWTVSAVTFNNCVFDPIEMNIGSNNSATFARPNDSNTVININNCYFTYDLNDGTNNVGQGKKAFVINSESPATVELCGTATTYNKSRITTYSDNNGLLYNGTIIAGEDDQVLLNLGGGTIYLVSNGILTGSANPYSLIMDARPATFRAVQTHIVSTVTDSSTQMTWETFASYLPYGYRFSGLTVYLDEDITITTSATGWFMGTFDGQGHTITCNLEGSAEYCAPFAYAEDAAFQNLKVTGTINTTRGKAAGFVGLIAGDSCSFINCESNIAINVTDFCLCHGGFVGEIRTGTTYFHGCAFTGSLTDNSSSDSPSGCGGFVGNCLGGTNTLLYDCVFAPTEINFSDFCATFVRAIQYTLTNCYYTQSFGWSEQGKQACTITATSPVIAELDGTATNYNMSHITTYSGNQGLIYNGTIIAGEGDHVNLNLDGCETYDASHGNLRGEANPYTLDMAAYNTVISPSLKTIIGENEQTFNWTPLRNRFNYSLTQQIYTTAELGAAGNIVSIDFFKANDVECVRNLEIYMMHSDVEEFRWGTDWVQVSSADLVFSGTVTFGDNCWTTITFDTPFYYDGQHNVVLTVDDNTGSTNGEEAYFRVFHATSSSGELLQTLNYYSNTVNSNPLGTPEESINVISLKNQVRIMKLLPPSAPYNTDFETTCDWKFVNGSCTNKWCWGTAAHNGNGTHGLYISNDGGTTNAYTFNSSSMVYAYKTFHFEAGIYDISYDWKAYGENGYDFLRVALVPASVNLEASTSMPSDFNIISLPEGWIALDESSQLNLSTDWQNKDCYFTVIDTAGDYKMVFAWWNDFNLGTNPPAAIDNVNIEAVPCVTPRNLTASNLTATTADLSWIGGSDVESYTLKYKTEEYFNAIFTEGFENGLVNWTLRDCEANTGIYSEAAHWGSAGFRFYKSNTPQYLISPELTGIDEEMELYFYFRNNGTGDIHEEPFYFGYSTTDNETESFTFEEIASLNGEMWYLIRQVPVGTKYVCWKYASDNCDLHIDDIKIGYDVPAGEWQTVTVAGGPIQMSTTLTGLIPETPYQAWAASSCNTTGSSSYLAHFTTLPTCVTPADLTVSNVSATTANLSWTGGLEVDSYTVKYRISSTVFTESFENGLDDWTLLNCDEHSAIYNFTEFGFHWNTAPPQYLISPELTRFSLEGMRLEFYYRIGDVEYPETFQVGFSTTDNAIESFTFGEEITASNLEWIHYSESIPAGTKYICWKCTSNDRYLLFIDDIMVETVAPAEWQTATVAGNTTEVNATLNGLIPETPYETFAYPNCNPNKKSEMVKFSTGEEPLSPLPYSTDFETTFDWVVVNGNCTNAWSWGTAAHNGEGTHGLYISNEDGSTNAYTNTSNTMVYTYKTFHFEAGYYSLSFDWNAKGENNYDFLRVALVPGTVWLGSGTTLPSGFDFNTLPEGWIALDGGSQLNMATDWKTMSQEIEIATAGNYKMVFAWRNDNSVGTNPPAAIDNVSIEAITCPTPVNLFVNNITSITTDLSWTAVMPTDSYTVKYRTAQSLNAIFTEGFEGGAMPSGWTQSGPGIWNVTEGYGYNSIGTHSGTYNATINHTNRDDETFLITPMLDLSGQNDLYLNFWYINHNWGASDVDQLYVYYRVNEGEWIELWNTTEDHQTWTKSGAIALPNPSANYQIGFKMIDKYGHGVGIDDIAIGAEAPAGQWQTATVAGNATEVSALLTGLTPETEYEAFVYPDCDPDKVTDTVSFMTDVPCPIPHDLDVNNIRPISAVLSWTGDPGVESYTAKYRKTGLVFTEGFENGIDGWTLRDCHVSSGITTSNNAVHSGNAAFYFYFNTNPPQYLISPELSGVIEGMRLEFYYRNHSTDYPETFHIGFSSTDNATESFTFGEGITAADTQWHLYSGTIPAGTKYICWKLTSYDKYYLFIDDIAVGAENATDEWQTATVAGNTTEVSTMLTGLTPETEYEAFVYSDCDPDKASNTIQFKTIELPLPYFTDFETTCDWTLVNGDRTNAWTWGTAAHNGGGTHGLYISNDGGTTNAYEYESGNQALYPGTVVYAYKTLDFSDGIYEFSYDWRANGWSFSDYLRVALVPDSDSLQASRTTPDGLGYNSLPSGWIALDGGSKLNLSTEWKTEDRIVEVPSGTYKMVFIWVNAIFQTPANPPAAIDNVSVEVATCPKPENLTVSNISAHSARLNWDVMVSTDSYTVKYRPTFVPLDEGFENGIGDWTIRNGGNNTGISQYGNWFLFYPTSSSQYLISPLLTDMGQGMRLDFYYSSVGPSDQSFQVGFSSTNNATASFTFGETITTGDYQWHHLYLAIPAGTKYICWKWIPNGEYGLELDNIMVSREPSAGEWLTTTVVNNNLQVSAILTGLSPETEYEAMVYPDCNPNKLSELVKFTTMESCPTPTDFVASNITEFSADLSWTGDIEVESYTVKYKPSGIVFTESFENGLGDWTLRNCHDETGVINYSGHSNATSFMFKSSNPPQYLISPELAYNVGGVKLEFYYRTSSSMQESFCVGYSTTDNATESFTFGEEIIAPDWEWRLYSVTFPAGTNYICWKLTSRTYQFLYIDDITISMDPLPQWQTVSVVGGTNQVNTTLNNLDLETLYKVVVYPDCNPDKVSDTIQFITLPYSLAISGYGTGNGNWHLIALPVTSIKPNNVAGMTDGDYDLYRFNPSHEDNEWENYEDEPFKLVNGHGYLYAHDTDVTLTFSGMSNTATGSVEVPLEYDADDGHKCWNLVGNPFPCEATINKPYYVLDAEGTGINPEPLPAGTSISPYTAVFVKATGAGQTVVFTKVAQ